MPWRPSAALLVVALATVATGCRVHIVGDSTAALVQAHANAAGAVMTGSVSPGCGFVPVNGNRIQPELLGTGSGYGSCVLDWMQSGPDDPDDYVVGFVSVHDAMCSTVDGCLPFETDVYAEVDADLRSYGLPVYWVEVPPFGGPLMQARIDGLNAAVAAELGCALVPDDIRIAPMYDPLHYLPDGALTVGARLALLPDFFEPC